MSDFRKALELILYFVYKAYLKLQVQYRQTRFGLLWDPLSLIIVTSLISLVWSVVFQENNFTDFFAYILSGYTIWMLISSLIDSGTGVFLKNRNSMANEYQPLIFYCIENIILHTIRFLLILPIAVLLLMFVGHFNFFNNLIYFILSLLSIIIFGLSISFILGTLALFYKDVKFIINSIMRLAFLLTPIIWKSERLGEYKNFLFLNPFYPFLELSRSTLIYAQIDRTLLFTVMLESIIMLFIGLILVNKFENKIRIHCFKL